MILIPKTAQKNQAFPRHFLPGTVAAKPGGKGGLSGALRMIPIPSWGSSENHQPKSTGAEKRGYVIVPMEGNYSIYRLGIYSIYKFVLSTLL